MKKLSIMLIAFLSFSAIILPTADANGGFAQTRKSKRKYKKNHTRTSRSVSSSSSASGNYIRGRRGGCYYINRNGNKTYVSRSLCN